MTTSQHTFETFATDCETLAKLAAAGSQTKSWNPAAVKASMLSQQLAGVFERSQDLQMTEVEAELGMSFVDFINRTNDKDANMDSAIMVIERTTHAKLYKAAQDHGVMEMISWYINHHRNKGTV
jgi:hypothetical protein